MAATMAATNPFDDSYEESAGGTNPFASSSAPRNPFDDDEDDEDDEGMIVATTMDDDDEEKAEPAEASWQYLGDLPYRRIPVYSHVRWSPAEAAASSSSSAWWYQGLSRYPHATSAPAPMTARERRQWVQASSVTHVAGCPHGGPIAALTVPTTAASSSSSSSSSNNSWRQSTLRILTNAGQLLAAVAIPPAPWHHAYTAADVLGIGFTSRSICLVVMRDSLAFTYTLQGEPWLDPFYILPTGEQQGADLLAAQVYEGGVAVLAQSKQVAICELLDAHDDDDEGGEEGQSYLSTAHVTARVIRKTTETGVPSSSSSGYALVTEIPLATQAATTNFRALAVLPRHRTKSRHPEIFVSTTHPPSVWILEAATCNVVDVECSLVAPILKMAFSPNGRFLACFTQDAMLTVISTSFETKVLDFDTSEGATTPPSALEWCGEDSVVLHWKNMGILMVGPYGDWLRFPYPQTESLYLLPEIDCCRVLTDAAVEILQRVPPTTAAMLRIGSIEPGAMLLDAADRFAAGTPVSDDTARSMRQSGQLDSAIGACVEGALREFDILTQKRLLAAASYGMHYAYKTTNGADEEDDRRVLGGPLEFNPDSAHASNLWPSETTLEFVATARKLRILNALRNPKVGFVLTASQLEALTPTGVVARLVSMKRPALATSISKYLRLPRAVQLYCRACQASAVVQAAPQDASDTETAEKALRILHGDETANPSVSYRGGYATIAMAASKAGRAGVANLLLMMETSVADKVPALLGTGAFTDAVAVATNAKDHDFIVAGLMAYEHSMIKTATSANEVGKAKSNFMGALVTKCTPEAFHTWRLFLEGQGDLKAVTNLHLRAQNFADAGATLALRALSESDFRERRGMLDEASRVFGLGKETAFAKSCTDEYLDLLKDQEVLRNMYGTADVAPPSTSVTNTIAAVLGFAAVQFREQHRLLSDADKLAKKFRVPEKRLWHTKVKAFAESNQWSNLRLLCDSRAKPPIGFKPFVRAVIRGKQPQQEILRYLERLPSPEERYDMYCEAALWSKALEEAVRMRDGQRILNVKSLCNNAELQLQADQALGRLA